MKYAIVDKGNGTELLVSFPNIAVRQEQQIRFCYEFPEGTFRPVDYPTARHAFKFRSTDEIRLPCELCGGQVFKAGMRRDDYYKLLFGDGYYYDHADFKGVI